MRRNQFEAIMEAIGTINTRVDGLETELKALQKAPSKTASTKKTTAKKSSKKSAPSTKKATKKTTAPKVEVTKTEMPKKLADFEPRKYDGFYRWGTKSDGFNQKSYMGMRKAYCVFKATDGKFLDSDKAYKAGIRIDYSENGKYAKAKAEFEKKFKYIKKEDR